MDVTLEWSAKPGKGKNKKKHREGLIDVIEEVTQRLQNIVFSQHGKAGRVSVDAYANNLSIKLFSTSKHWTSVAVITENNFLPKKERKIIVSEPVAKFPKFTLHKDIIVAVDTVRVIAVFDVGTKAMQKMYGDVKLNDLEADDGLE